MHIKIGLLMVMSTTFGIGGAMKKAFVSNWLKSWFSGHVRTHFRHQLGGDVPDLIVAESRITAMRTSEGMINSK